MTLLCMVQFGLLFGALGSGAFGAFNAIEFTYSWLPLNGFVQGFIKILYRGKWKKAGEKSDTDPWGT